LFPKIFQRCPNHAHRHSSSVWFLSHCFWVTPGVNHLQARCWFFKARLGQT
jgi:hypothetical protein